MPTGEVDRIKPRLLRRLDAHAVVHHPLHAVRIERVDDGARGRESRDHRIGDDERATDAPIGEIHSQFTRDAGTVAHSGHGHLEGVISFDSDHVATLARERRRRKPSPFHERGRARLRWNERILRT